MGSRELRRDSLTIFFVVVSRDSWLSFDDLLQQASSDYQASFNYYFFIA